MADIFISYSKTDEADVRLLSAFLEAQGYSVWWDNDLLGGEKYRGVITAELSKARAVVVIWTKDSVGSDWVQSEAGRALRDQKLIPVRSVGIEYKDIPPPFDNVHTVALNNRAQILAAVTGQLAKPAAGAPRWKVLRFEFLTWLGVIGGAITLITNINGIIKLSNFLQWLITNWSSLLKYLWQALLFFKFEVSAYDAELLTIGFLMTSAVFYASFRQPNAPARKSSIFLIFPLSLIWIILMTGIVSITTTQVTKAEQKFDQFVEDMFANSPECATYMKVFLRNINNFEGVVVPMPGNEPSLEAKERADDCFKSAAVKLERERVYVHAMTREFDQERDRSIWISTVRSVKNEALGGTLMVVAMLSPILLPFVFYGIISCFFSLKLNASALSRRLWRTLIVFGIIIVMNYVALGIETGKDWLRAIPDLI